MNVAVVGGAGFIGSHLVDALVERGFRVRVIDNLEPQVHPNGLPPSYLNPRIEFIQQDVRDMAGLRDAIKGAEAVFYLAGAVGVGDSMYRIRHYADVNVLGGSGEMGSAAVADQAKNRREAMRMRMSLSCYA